MRNLPLVVLRTACYGAGLVWHYAKQAMLWAIAGIIAPVFWWVTLPMAIAWAWRRWRGKKAGSGTTTLGRPMSHDSAGF